MAMNKTIEPPYHLKVSESEKYKEGGQWFKDYINYLVPYDTTVVDDYAQMKLAYDIVNNNIDGFARELEAFINPTGEDDLLPDGYKDEILPYVRINNKVNVLIGELIKRSDDLKIILLSDKEVKDKSEALKEAIRQSIEEELQLVVEKTKLLQSGLEQEEVEKQIEELRTQLTPEDLLNKKFMTEWEIFNTKAINYCKHSQEILDKKQLTLRHGITADRFFWYVGWEFGKPVIKVCNPLHCGFHKSPDVVYVEKGDYFWYKKAITIADAFNKYANDLSDDDFEKLQIYTPLGNLRVDKRHDVTSGKASKVFDTTTEEMFRHSQDIHDKTVGQAQGSGTNRKYNTERLIWETHIEFKAFREIIFLSYIDEYGEEITEIVDSKFNIPKNATRYKFTNKFGNKSIKYEWADELLGSSFSAEKLWIPRRYEVTRLGEDIYVNMREVPNQPLNVDDPYGSFELSYKGRILSNVNSKSISLVQRAIPAQMEALYVKLILNRELAKYQGFTVDIDVDQIPDYLGQDENGKPVRDKVAVWQLYVKKLGKNFYSGSQSADGLPPSTRSPGSRSSMTGTAGELINLMRLIEMLDVEIGLAMGISPQREALFSSGTNVTDNQQAITQSHHITEPYFFMHSECWKRVMNEWLKLFRIYCKDIFERNPQKKEHFIHYILPNGSEELLRITPEVLDHNDIGLYISSSGQDQFYRRMMTDMVHTFGQNAGEGVEIVSSLVKAISNGESPEEIHKRITIESNKQQERIEQMKQFEMQKMEEIEKMKIDAREDEQAHEIEKEHVKGDYMLQRAAIDVYKLQQDLDKDNDGQPDPLESMIALNKIRQDDEKLDIDREKLKIDREKIKQDARNISNKKSNK